MLVHPEDLCVLSVKKGEEGLATNGGCVGAHPRVYAMMLNINGPLSAVRFGRGTCPPHFAMGQCDIHSILFYCPDL